MFFPPPPPPPSPPQVVVVSQVEAKAQAESVTEGLMRELALNAMEGDVDASATAIAEVARGGEGPNAAALRQAAASDAGVVVIEALAAFGTRMLGAFAEGFKEALLGDAKQMGSSVHNWVRDAVLELYRAQVKPKAQHWWRRRASAPEVDSEVRSLRITDRARTAATIVELAKLAVSQQEDALRRAADDTEATVREELLGSGLFDAEGARAVARSARNQALRRAGVALAPVANPRG